MSAYYNEFDPYAAQWLRNLIAAGHIAPGDVDERSILEVKPDDLRGYTQCHFFAGIGGWSYALRLAGRADSRPVWTGSCPCQPFSSAGAQRGSDDERHLWPAFFRLISECRPARVFGEQVAGAAGLAWLDHVCADLEDAGYAAAAANIGAHSVGAPHIRPRLYWVADTTDVRSCDACERSFARFRCNAPYECDCPRCQGYCDCVMAHADSAGSLLSQRDGKQEEPEQPASCGHNADGRCEVFRLGHATEPGSQGRDEPRQRVDAQRQPIERTGSLDAWGAIEWLPCSDGKARPTQSGLQPLAHGVSGRVGRLRAYGNAIVPQVAAAFIKACE